MATPEARIVAALRRANEGVAIGVGVALLGACAYTLADVIGRPLGLAPGGNEEIAGYVMAGATSWGMAYGLLALAHVRIDFVRMRAARPGRAALDLLAMLALTATTLLIAAHAWPFVEQGKLRPVMDQSFPLAQAAAAHARMEAGAHIGKIVLML